MFSFDQYPPLMLTFLNLPPKIGAAADLFFTPIIAQIRVRKQRCKIEKNPFRTLIPPWNSVKGGNSCVVIKWHLQENTKIIRHGKTISRVFFFARVWKINCKYQRQIDGFEWRDWRRVYKIILCLKKILKTKDANNVNKWGSS